ncbi:ABC transporter permease [Peptoniphilus sp. GNH]|nr:putative D-methionine transport system permease protein MetI [Clostridiales bacterium KA00134]UHR02504.1 ABC transporter permease [Peptoniphilus sp. GNH]
MNYFANALAIKDDFLSASISTLYMTFFTAIFAGLVGLILGVILVTTRPGAILENKFLNSFLDKLINLLRSVPFIIMLTFIAPLTRLIAGTSIGQRAAIVPLFFAAFPFFAKQVESALADVDKGVIEAALSMGDSNADIILRVYLKEGLANIIRASSLTLISLVGLTAMAGAIGAGGLGQIAINVGYGRFQDDVTLVCLIIILIIVFIIQGVSNILIKKVEK